MSVGVVIFFVYFAMCCFHWYIYNVSCQYIYVIWLKCGSECQQVNVYIDQQEKGSIGCTLYIYEKKRELRTRLVYVASL